MTKIRITYHIVQASMEGETCIDLPMTEEHAEELMARQEKSRLISGPHYDKGILATTLDRLAKLQGHHFARFICAERI